MKFSDLLYTALLLNCSLAVAQTEPPSYTRSIDICASLPGGNCLPGFEGEVPFDFALPDDFTVLSMEPSQGTLLGNIQALKKYISGEKEELKSCIIVVKESQSVKQKGSNDFETDLKSRREFKCLGRAREKTVKLRWGSYPLLTSECISLGGNHYYLAWLGLNREDGKTLLFTFLCPNKNNQATAIELAIWMNFLLNTKEKLINNESGTFNGTSKNIHHGY